MMPLTPVIYVTYRIYQKCVWYIWKLVYIICHLKTWRWFISLLCAIPIWTLKNKFGFYFIILIKFNMDFKLTFIKYYWLWLQFSLDQLFVRHEKQNDSPDKVKFI